MTKTMILAALVAALAAPVTAGGKDDRQMEAAPSKGGEISAGRDREIVRDREAIRTERKSREIVAQSGDGEI